MTKPKWMNRLAEVFNSSRLSRNTGQKIISLLFAILFWLYVMDQVNPEMVKELANVQVEFLNAASVTQNGLVIMDEQEFFVDVKVKGRRNDLFDVTNEDVRVTADLSGYGKGTNSVPLETRTFNGSFTVNDLSQKEIKIFLDKVVEISKPVNITVSGEIKGGYVKGDLEYAPVEISVRGPESYVNTVAMIQGEMKIDNATGAIEKELPVMPVDNDGNVVNGVTLGRDYVRASIGIDKLKTLAVNERLSGQVASGYELVRVQIAPAAVTIRGSESDVDAIERLYTKAIDISGIRNTEDIEVGLDLPEGITAPYLNEPVTASVFVEAYETKTFIIPGSDIPIRNMDDAFIVTQRDISGTVEVTVRDIESVMKNVDVDSLNLYYDGSNLKPGIANEAVVKFELENTVRNISIDSDKVRIPVRLKELINNGGSDTQSGTDQPEESPATTDPPTDGENPTGSDSTGNAETQ